MRFASLHLSFPICSNQIFHPGHPNTEVVVPGACNCKGWRSEQFFSILPADEHNGFREVGPSSCQQLHRICCCQTKPTFDVPIAEFQDLIAKTHSIRSFNAPEAMAVDRGGKAEIHSSIKKYAAVGEAAVVDMPQNSPSLKAASILFSMRRLLKRV
eukprot:scaffold1610_cov257-Pinguiococcus_pyrenoidosus.AAC.26